MTTLELLYSFCLYYDDITLLLYSVIQDYILYSVTNHFYCYMLFLHLNCIFILLICKADTIFPPLNTVISLCTIKAKPEFIL